MSFSVIIPDGIITIPDSFFPCPKCEFPISSEDYLIRLERTPRINAKCPNCNTKLILTINYKNGISAYIKPKNNHMSNSVPKTLERDFEYKNHKFRINVILNYEKGLISKENKHQLKLSYLGSRNFQKTILCESYSLSMEITRLQSEAKNWVDSESGVSEEETILEMLGFKRV